MKSEPHMGTRAIHGGEPRPRIGRALTIPIFQSSVFETDAVERARVGLEGSSIPAHERYSALPYIRLSNTPNHLAVQQKLADLEGAESALVTASGMAAISAVLLTVLSPGDHLMIQQPIYGGTQVFVEHELQRFGISHTWIDTTDPTSWDEKRLSTTRAIYAETLSNPLVRVPSLREVVLYARLHGLVSIIDNTFATPVNFRAVAFGFDLALHSCTKYMGGHSDLQAGCVLGRTDLIQQLTARVADYGGCLSPLECFLLQRSLKTLPVRMRQHNENATALARYLAQHPAVSAVSYPGIEVDPQHTQACLYLAGCSGVLSFELSGGVEATNRLCERLRYVSVAPSLGGVETTLTRPALTSHFNLPRAERARLGITEALVRLSVGLEDIEDLIADFEQALEC